MSELLSDDEVQRLILMLGYGQGEAGFTEADFESVLQWAEGVRIGMGLLETVLDASMAPTVVEGEILFKATAKGDREVEALIRKALIRAAGGNPDEVAQTLGNQESLIS